MGLGPGTLPTKRWRALRVCAGLISLCGNVFPSFMLSVSSFVLLSASNQGPQANSYFLYFRSVGVGLGVCTLAQSGMYVATSPASAVRWIHWSRRTQALQGAGSYAYFFSSCSKSRWYHLSLVCVLSVLSDLEACPGLFCGWHLSAF